MMGFASMPKRKLLDRQIELLQHLTCAELLFDGETLPEALRDPTLHGISIPRLRLEAEMSFRKRMGKIAKVLKRTYACLGGQRSRLLRNFAAAWPPQSYRNYDEAARFHEFLQNYWRTVSPDPPFIVDIAKLEMALARMKLFRVAENSAPPPILSELSEKRPLVRVAAGVEILPMDYDLRSFFEDGTAKGAPTKRRHYLIVAPGPKVAESPQALASIFERPGTWTALERVLDEIEPDGADVKASLHGFLNAGFLEINR
jgi:hypothetical protein